MTNYYSELAPDNLPLITYFITDYDLAGHMSEAMTSVENQAKFDLSYIPIDTPDARRIAAEEWADYKQARGDADARERGAYAILSSKDESPESFERTFEEFLVDPDFSVHALAKITLKTHDAETYDIMRNYYEPAAE